MMAGNENTGRQAGESLAHLASLGVPAPSLPAVSAQAQNTAPPPSGGGAPTRRGSGRKGSGTGPRGTKDRAWDDPEHLRYLWERYGLDSRQAERLYEAQGGRCAVCTLEYVARHGREPDPLPRSEWHVLHVDHDHRTLLVRGLLCHRHNRAITQPIADYLADPIGGAELAYVPEWLERRAVRSRQRAADTTRRRRATAKRGAR